jgi:hypothetical protein
MLEAGAMRIAMNQQHVGTAEAKAGMVWRDMVAAAHTPEIARLRAEQAAGVMPQIGPLLDAWDSLDNDAKAVLREEAPDLARALTAIGRAMDGTSGVKTVAAPRGNPEVMEPFWCHEQSHDRPRCEAQCAECAEDGAPASDPDCFIGGAAGEATYGVNAVAAPLVDWPAIHRGFASAAPAVEAAAARINEAAEALMANHFGGLGLRGPNVNDPPTYPRPPAPPRPPGALVGDGTGQALPPLPDSAYPPGAKPIPGGVDSSRGGQS